MDITIYISIYCTNSLLYLTKFAIQVDRRILITQQLRVNDEKYFFCIKDIIYLYLLF